MTPKLDNLNYTKTASTVPISAADLPGPLPALSKSKVLDKFRIRYRKFDLDSPADIIDLEQIETNAIQDRGVYILSKKEFPFMSQIFVVVQYLEEIKDSR